MRASGAVVRRTMRAPAILAVALLSTACASAPALSYVADSRTAAIPVAELTCAGAATGASAIAGLVPRDFDAVALIRCDDDAALVADSSAATEPA